MSGKTKAPEKNIVNIYDGEKYKLVHTPRGDKYVLDLGEENEDEKKSRK